MVAKMLICLQPSAVWMFSLIMFLINLIWYKILAFSTESQPNGFWLASRLRCHMTESCKVQLMSCSQILQLLRAAERSLEVKCVLFYCDNKSKAMHFLKCIMIIWAVLTLVSGFVRNLSAWKWKSNHMKKCT